MLLVEGREAAIACLAVSLILLGTWPALLSVCERRGRALAHAYLDYAVAYLLVGAAASLLFGNVGPATKPSTFEQLRGLGQAAPAGIGFSMLSGVLLALGNCSTQWGVALVGLTVCLPLQGALTVVLGTVANYFLDDALNRADLLFTGVACFLVALVLDVGAHAANARAQCARGAGDAIDLEISVRSQLSTPPDTSDTVLDAKSLGSDGAAAVPAAASAVACRVAEHNPNRALGIAIAAAGGVCFAAFSPAFNLATQARLLPPGMWPLTVWTAYFFFSIAFVLAAFALNLVLLAKPTMGQPRSSIAGWLADNHTRGPALLAGGVCAVANALQFLGGQAAGFAAADAVEAYPLWSMLLGVAMGELRHGSRRACALLIATWFAYLAATALLVASAAARPSLQ